MWKRMVVSENSMVNMGLCSYGGCRRVVAAALVLSVLVLAGSANAAEPVGPGLSLKLRGLLVEEMLAIESAMQVTYGAIIQGNHTMVAKQGRAIHDSFILAQSLTEQDRKDLKAAVPAEFLQMDKRLHQLAALLAEAAEQENTTEQVKLFGHMTESCLACHGRYVTDRFDGLQNQRLPQSWGQAEH